MKAIVYVLVSSSLMASTYPTSAWKAPERTNYVSLFRARADRANMEVQRQALALPVREKELEIALKGNSTNPGSFSSAQVERLEIAVNEAKTDIALANALAKEAHDLAVLVEQAVGLGIELPIQMQMRP